MAEFGEVLSVLNTVQDSVTKKMAAVEAQIQNAGPCKDTVAKVAEEFRTFRELIFSILRLLRVQMSESAKQIDHLEMRHRRKALVFQGVPEADKEDTAGVVLDVLHNKLALKVEPGSIATCHRIGAMSKDHHRPILIKFMTIETKATVWRAKTRLRGTSISAKEFLTRTRQAVFARARQHFGMRICWTQDGVIHVKVPDGTRHKVTTDAELDVLLKKYPKSSGVSSMESDVGAARQLKPAKK
ncbi:hypothetical protein HW555_005419 [Spodoptera exigua]|uniref:Uncharacterized protein n=1 Tax=Spodoptera exigua TaxID=7107 RepID=A0A835GH40_SPOEX|nr:hypothetical protein HW555_005419 [Spodoptera exigua]